MEKHNMRRRTDTRGRVIMELSAVSCILIPPTPMTVSKIIINIISSSDRKKKTIF